MPVAMPVAVPVAVLTALSVAWTAIMGLHTDEMAVAETCLCLHTIAGVERAGEARSRAAAQLSHEAETRLREAVYAAAATSGGGARSPAEAAAVLLQQPFDDLRTATYRRVDWCCIAEAAEGTWTMLMLVVLRRAIHARHLGHSIDLRHC